MSAIRISVSLLLTICCVAAEPWKFSVTIDLGTQDLGQNFGSIFEMRGKDGSTVGAGFMGAYNTKPRSARYTLHFYRKPAGAGTKPGISVLPKPTTDAGVYLYQYDGRLFGKSRNGTDPLLRVWDAKKNQWQIDKTSAVQPTQIGTGELSLSSKAILWNGASLLAVPSPLARFGELYYANGTLVVRVHDKLSKPGMNEIIALKWQPGESQPDLSKGVVLRLRALKEFVYGFGVLGKKVIVATNTGGVYEYDEGVWRAMIEPDTTTSFQIYTVLNFRDRLWMGQYPTGNLFEYDGRTVTHLSGTPPVVTGAHARAREAQTLAIYRGDVYCGVWPWGEVWRFDTHTLKWDFVGRMFSHPELNDRFRHPYEAEMLELKETANKWGQRITSMIPFGDSLYIGTSAKTSAPYDESYVGFLGDGRWKEYGNVHRLSLPGHLAVNLQWTGGRIKLDFEIGEKSLRVFQDGKLLGTASLPEGIAGFETRSEKLGDGVYGHFTGKILK
ncbi:MAG: hypothetical protein ACI9OD_003470 [Limisphaerales bacterium]|jgi:hypothetical protein